MQSNFCAGAKKIEPAQSILGPVKGQGINEFYNKGLEEKISTVGFMHKTFVLTAKVAFL
jgi:hypothetical protein